MPDFSASNQVPIIETVADQRVTFQLVKARDLAPLTEQMKADRKDSAKKLVEKFKLNQVQSLRLEQEIDDWEISTVELMARIRTQPGSEQIIKLSLAKAGYTDEQQQAIADELDPIEQTNLALRVTRIVKLPSAPASKLPEAAQRPLESSGEPTAMTGSPSTPGSGNTSPEPIPAT